MLVTKQVVPGISDEVLGRRIHRPGGIERWMAESGKCFERQYQMKFRTDSRGAFHRKLATHQGGKLP